MKDPTPTSIISESRELAPSVHAAQREAEARNAAIRQAERQAKMDAWKDPEVMAYRKAVHEKGAIESLWSLRQAGQCVADRDVPLPAREDLPPALRDQQPSTIRASLRGDPAWQAKVKAHMAVEEKKDTVRSKYPELFGIDYSKLRPELDVKLGDEHKVRTGKTLKIKESGHIHLPPQEEPKKNAVARWFAGIWNAFEDT